MGNDVFSVIFVSVLLIRSVCGTKRSKRGIITLINETKRFPESDCLPVVLLFRRFRVKFSVLLFAGCSQYQEPRRAEQLGVVDRGNRRGNRFSFLFRNFKFLNN